MKKTLTLLITLSLPAPALAGFFKCESADGRIQYSDTPCAQSTTYNKDVAAAPLPTRPAAPVAVPAPATVAPVERLTTPAALAADYCREQGLQYVPELNACKSQ